MNGPGGHADPAYLLDSAGPAAPPRDNGELVFAAPWESRAFGLALALNEAGLIDPGVLAERAALLAARPAGHDHAQHGHDGHERTMHNGNPGDP